MIKTKKIRIRKLNYQTMSADTVYTFANWFLIGALVVGALATIAVVASGKIKEGRLNQELKEAREQIAISNQKAAEANQKAAEANLKAAEATQKAAEATQKAAEEKLARVKIEESIAWRRISNDQQSKLKNKLIKYAGHPVNFWYGAGDKEAETFAWELANTFNAAMWKVFSPASMVNLAESGLPFGSASPHETGVVITSSKNKSSQKASLVIVHELLSLGFDATKSSKLEEFDGQMIWVHVWVRPQGPQGEAKLKVRNDE